MRALSKHLHRLTARAMSLLAAVPFVVGFLTDDDIGRAYGAGFSAKLRLLVRFARNSRRVETLSSIKEHMELAAAILTVSPDIPGDIVECGCYVGGSSVNLSLVCAMAGRRLVIYDSFEGLPEPGEHDRKHVYLHYGTTDDYYKGRFAASLELVKANIAMGGELSVCDFVPGFFQDTLPGKQGPTVAAFLDVDLIDSLKPCLIGLWPVLAPDARLYVHEAASLSLVSLFFNSQWWREQFDEPAPGFVGTGTGLPLTAVEGSKLGYAQKGAWIVD